MKKFLYVLLMLPMFLFAGCSNNNLFNLAKNNIAEARYNLYVGETENLKVMLTSGIRESDYVINGYCSDPCDFGVLTFNFKTQITLPETVNYVLTVGTVRFDGVLEQNPYDGSYVCDVKTIVNSSDVVSAKIIAGEFVESVELTCVNQNWNVDYIKALNLACDELNQKISTFIENDQFLGECYIKILNDDELGANCYYWYVNFVSRKGENYACIIDPISNEIMAKKEL